MFRDVPECSLFQILSTAWVANLRTCTGGILALLPLSCNSNSRIALASLSPLFGKIRKKLRLLQAKDADSIIAVEICWDSCFDFFSPVTARGSVVF